MTSENYSPIALYTPEVRQQIHQPAFIWACLRWYVNLPVGNWFFSGAPNQQHQGISISTRSKVSISRTGCVFFFLPFVVFQGYHDLPFVRGVCLPYAGVWSRGVETTSQIYIYIVWYSVDSTLAIWKITYIILSFFIYNEHFFGCIDSIDSIDSIYIYWLHEYPEIISHLITRKSNKLDPLEFGTCNEVAEAPETKRAIF